MSSKGDPKKPPHGGGSEATSSGSPPGNAQLEKVLPQVYDMLIAIRKDLQDSRVRLEKLESGRGQGGGGEDARGVLDPPPSVATTSLLSDVLLNKPAVTEGTPSASASDPDRTLNAKPKEPTPEGTSRAILSTEPKPTESRQGGSSPVPNAVEQDTSRTLSESVGSRTSLASPQGSPRSGTAWQTRTPVRAASSVAAATNSGWLDAFGASLAPALDPVANMFWTTTAYAGDLRTLLGVMRIPPVTACSYMSQRKKVEGVQQAPSPELSDPARAAIKTVLATNGTKSLTFDLISDMLIKVGAWVNSSPATTKAGAISAAFGVTVYNADEWLPKQLRAYEDACISRELEQGLLPFPFFTDAGFLARVSSTEISALGVRDLWLLYLIYGWARETLFAEFDPHDFLERELTQQGNLSLPLDLAMGSTAQRDPKHFRGHMDKLFAAMATVERSVSQPTTLRWLDILFPTAEVISHNKPIFSRNLRTVLMADGLSSRLPSTEFPSALDVSTAITSIISMNDNLVTTTVRRYGLPPQLSSSSSISFAGSSDSREGGGAARGREGGKASGHGRRSGATQRSVSERSREPSRDPSGRAPCKHCGKESHRSIYCFKQCSCTTYSTLPALHRVRDCSMIAFKAEKGDTSPYTAPTTFKWVDGIDQHAGTGETDYLKSRALKAETRASAGKALPTTPSGSVSLSPSGGEASRSSSTGSRLSTPRSGTASPVRSGYVKRSGTPSARGGGGRD